MTATRVLTIGETMALLTPSRIASLADAGPFRLGFGGSESNVAIGLARLGHTASWVGRVGDDVLGRMILSRIGAEGVDVGSAIVDQEASTGLMIREQRSALTTSVHYVRAGSAASRLVPGDIPSIGPTDHVHLTGITPALGIGPATAIQRAVDLAGDVAATVSFDVNYRRALWSRERASAVLRPLARRATIVFASTDEIDLVASGGTPLDAARSLIADGCSVVVLKRGPGGAIEVGAGSDIEVDGVIVPEVDPVGAGDAFVASWLAAMLEGAGGEVRLRQAVMASAYAVTVPGDFEGMPTAADLAQVGRPVGSVER